MPRLSKIDPNSYSTPETVLLTHINLVWNVHFDKTILSGTAELTFDVKDEEITQIFLDVNDLVINSIDICSGKALIPVTYFVSDFVKNIGSKLTIELPTATTGRIIVLIDYATTPKASALQWLTPEQTLGKKHPYLFSQCQAIHARSILPCQDTPAVKFTYNAIIKHPQELKALMSAIITKQEDSMTHFEQTVPIPSYLIAVAVGALVSKDLSPNCKVWAEEDQIEAAAYEFSETPAFLKTAEEICGPYVWKRYDLLVMPPSFPYGGMENPCLTFVTPTLLAGDRSLADVVAHEISHSWTGNLVTNKNFEHFWLNEGFTVFVEGKIIGRLHGPQSRDFHSIQGLYELKDTINVQLINEPELTKLVVDLSNLSPDDSFSAIPYKKGSTFLRYIENLFDGPDTFEPFFRHYLQKYKFQSIVTNDFKKALYEYFNEEKYEVKLEEIDWDTWLFGTGMPPVIPKYDETLAAVVYEHAALWCNSSLDKIKSSSLIKNQLTSTQKIGFLSKMLESDNIIDLNDEKLILLASTYNINKTKNSAILFRFYRLCIKGRYIIGINDIFVFLNSNFRMKFAASLYRDLYNWPEVREQTITNFEEVKNQMMHVCAYTVAKILGLNAD